MKKWRKLYEQQATIVCPYCLKPIPDGELSKDHKTPKSRGGDSTKQNLVWCCKACNGEKGALTVAEYDEWKRLEFIRNGGLSRKVR